MCQHSRMHPAMAYHTLTQWLSCERYSIPAKPLHNRDIVSVHFNHFLCMGICDKLSKHLSMLTYIYLNVGECWLTSSMPQWRFKLKFLIIMVKFNKMWFPVQIVLMLEIVLTWSWSIPVWWYLISTNNDRHILYTWLDKDYRLLGMRACTLYIWQ